MDNFDDFENKNYQSVKKINYKLKDHVAYLWSMFRLVLRISVVLVKEIFENIFNAPQKKNLSGQLALVTGKIKRALWNEFGSNDYFIKPLNLIKLN